ncbi:MAG: hypothetical protein CHACPFDD_00040 [Phycisphaerae bacterium]|nr:hypothetical protein [Phycisphaerae bacterium]
MSVSSVYSAPREHMGVLLEPADAGRRLAARGAPPGFTILNADSRLLSASLRGRLELRGPVVVTGHQAEFFHAGVFAKVIAAERVAALSGGSHVFLTVDFDRLRSADIAVPQRTPAGARQVAVTYAERTDDEACERLPRLAREHWLDVFARVGACLEDYAASALGAYADAFLETPDGTIDFCEATARGRGGVERSLGLRPARELRASRLAETPEFLAFAAHIVRDARDFATAYNRAQADYRRRWHERHPGRPVPPLTIETGRVECPFWLVGRSGQRRRMYAAERGEQIELFAGDETIGSLRRGALGDVAGVAAVWSTALPTWSLRPRALTLSAFARLLLADLFVHGIGGARYDEMTESFVEAYFGTQAAPMACVTATLELFPEAARDGVVELRRARARSRDLRFNPQRHLREIPAELRRSREELVARGEQLRAERPRDRAARREVYQSLRRVNEQILRGDAWRPAEYDRIAAQAEEALLEARVQHEREYFFALHAREALSALVRAIGARIEA